MFRGFRFVWSSVEQCNLTWLINQFLRDKIIFSTYNYDAENL